MGSRRSDRARPHPRLAPRLLALGRRVRRLTSRTDRATETVSSPTTSPSVGWPDLRIAPVRPPHALLLHRRTLLRRTRVTHDRLTSRAGQHLRRHELLAKPTLSASHRGSMRPGLTIQRSALGPMQLPDMLTRRAKPASDTAAIRSSRHWVVGRETRHPQAERTPRVGGLSLRRNPGPYVVPSQSAADLPVGGSQLPSPYGVERAEVRLGQAPPTTMTPRPSAGGRRPTSPDAWLPGITRRRGTQAAADLIRSTEKHPPESHPGVRRQARVQPSLLIARASVPTTTASHAVSRKPSAAAAWTAAVRSRPLENPLPLPASLLRWGRAVSGRSAPRFTSGPATRAALGAAGALGASTADVVHLSTPPSSRSSTDPILRHELVHLRRPLSRTRFLLAGQDGSLDDEERETRARAADGGSALNAGAGIVAGLPVAGIGGGQAIAGLAKATAAQAVSEVLATGRIGGGTNDIGLPAADSAGSPQTGAAFAPQSPAGGSTPGDGATLGSGGGEASAGRQQGGPTGGSQAAAGEGGALSLQMVDQMVMALEDRVLAEIERRGGRYAGVF
jgi:hypothetical protein